MKRKRKPKTVIIRSFRPFAPSRSHFFQVLLFQSLCFLFSAAATGAQAVAGGGGPPADPHKQPYALIFGTVWGPDDRPVYGVKIRIRPQSQKKARWELYSDHNGEFALRVPAAKADYVVWADLKGYTSSSGAHLQPGDEVTVHVEYDERVDIGVHLK